MSFIPINTTDIQVGKPTSTDVQELIKTNFDNHEARLQTVESANTGDPPIILRVNGGYRVMSNVLWTVAAYNFNISGARLLVDQAGNAGNTEIDIRVVRGGTDLGSIFATTPKANFNDGNDFLTANTVNLSVASVLDSTKKSILAGDELHLDITSVQTAAKGFLVRIDYQR